VRGLWVNHSFDIGMPVDATSVSFIFYFFNFYIFIFNAVTFFICSFTYKIARCL
jgi:hypothetical protein